MMRSGVAVVGFPLAVVCSAAVCAGLGILLEANLTTGGGTNIGAGFFYPAGSGMCAVAVLVAAIACAQMVLRRRRQHP